MNRNTISTTEVLLTNTTAKLFNNQKIYNALYFGKNDNNRHCVMGVFRERSLLIRGDVMLKL